jgi:hypothetical protein
MPPLRSNRARTCRTVPPPPPTAAVQAFALALPRRALFSARLLADAWIRRPTCTQSTAPSPRVLNLRQPTVYPCTRPRCNTPLRANSRKCAYLPGVWRRPGGCWKSFVSHMLGGHRGYATGSLWLKEKILSCGPSFFFLDTLGVMFDCEACATVSLRL